MVEPGQGCEVLLIFRPGMEWKQASHQLGQRRLEWGQIWLVVFLKKGQGVCDHMMYITIGLDRGGGARQGSGKAVQTHLGPTRSEEVETIRSSFNFAGFVKSPKKPIIPGLVGVIEEETAVIGAALFSAPGFPAVPHPKASKHKSGKPP